MEQQQQPVSRVPPAQRLFLATLTCVAILSVGLVTIVVVSIIPHFGVIGWVATGVVCVVLVCIAGGAIAFTLSRIGLWRNNAHILRAGDVVIYVESGKIHHLSAEHERAKVPQITLPALSSPAREAEAGDTRHIPSEPDDEAVMSLFRANYSERRIAEELGVSRAAVRKSLGK